MNKYSVTVRYTLTLEREIEVEAPNASEADEAALEKAESTPWLKDPVDGFCEGVSDTDTDSFATSGTPDLLEGEEPEEEDQ